MGLEASTTISGLNKLWPLGTDQKQQGDDHLRLIKTVLQNDFDDATAGELALKVPGGAKAAIVKAGGVYLQAGSAGIFSPAATVAQGSIKETFITSSQTYTVGADALYIEIEGLGPGGQGGSSQSTGAATIAVGGAGGAGAGGKKLFTKAEVGTSIVFTLAAASSGGTSQFTTNGTIAGPITLGGGANGALGTAAAQVVTAGAAGGVGAGWSGGLYPGMTFPGAIGDVGYGGYWSSVSAQLHLSGNGASSAYGSGARGVFTGPAGAGLAATGYGAGGGGGYGGFSAASQNGGAGTGGFFRVREFY